MSDIAALETINRNIRVLNDNIGLVREDVSVVSRQVDNVAQDHATTRERLESLYSEFLRFLDADFKQKERQHAQTRIIEVRQEIEKRFGHYDTVRRHATGILQATDAGIVRKTTIQDITEKLMLDCPGYWLAPGLVALGGWVRNDAALAQTALNDSLRVDAMKTSMFFALVARRAGRREACGRWLANYFQLQSYTALDREVVVMIDAMVNGVFGGGALSQCAEVVDGWLDDLQDEPGFLDNQRRRWAEALSLMTPRIEPEIYPTLRAHSATWPALEAALAAVRRNAVVHDFFGSLLNGEIDIPRRLEVAVDDLLTKLVTEYDREELPLKREELHLRMVVDEGGDTARADHRFGIEVEALDERTDFAALLTNAAMHPDLSGASRATQRYAVATSKEWIVSGFNDLTAQDRAQVPVDVEIKAGSWEGSSRDGADEAPLVDSLTTHYAGRITTAVNAIALTVATWVIGVVGGFFGALIMLLNLRSAGGVVFGLMILAAAGGYFFFKQKDLENVRQRTRKALEKERDAAIAILRAALAELVDLRRDIAAEDAKAGDVVTFLESVDTTHLLIKRPEQARSVLA